ncbi:MAG: class I SAM-dependent methyltransferase [Thermoflexales bacterium]|nr:class I SAM-dependent methyltransferase [Thermoflexales bacterium]
MTDPTQRFSSRVSNYVKYRPSYPAAMVDLLTSECGLTPDAIVADVGSGTGLLAELFLKAGHHVWGIEPNREMREAGEQLLRKYERFVSIDATAEATTLPDHSVDVITAGQAFHWFDRTRVGAEFARILKPRGWIVLIWNERRTDSTPFLRAYEQLLNTYSTDYAQVDHRLVDRDVIGAAFPSVVFQRRTFDNQQRFDLADVTGRLLSSSYAPEAGHPRHAPMLAALTGIFEQYQTNGEIVFEYDTRVNYGQL